MAKVYLEAYACDDYGDGPTFAELDVTPEFCARLQRLAALGSEHQLTELRVSDSPDAWGPGDVAQDMHFTMPELVVAGDSFWFTDHPKHAKYSVETRGIGITGFCDDVAKQARSDPLFFGEDVDALRSCVADKVR